jgi:hypothetical protein
VLLWIRQSDVFQPGSGTLVANSQLPMLDGTAFRLSLLHGDVLQLVVGLNYSREVNSTSSSSSFGNVTVFSSSPIKANRWYHVAAVRSASDVRLYVDATLVGWSTIDASIQQSTRVISNFGIGCLPDQNGTGPSFAAGDVGFFSFLLSFFFKKKKKKKSL